MGFRRDLYSALKNGVFLVSNRIYPLVMPQDTQHSAVVYTVIGDAEQAGLCGIRHSSDMEVQIDVFAKEYSDSVAIKDEVIAAIRSSFNAAGVRNYEVYEDITLKYRQIITFRVNGYE